MGPLKNLSIFAPPLLTSFYFHDVILMRGGSLCLDFITNLDFLFCAREMKSLKAGEEHILDLEEQVISFHSFLSDYIRLWAKLLESYTFDL